MLAMFAPSAGTPAISSAGNDTSDVIAPAVPTIPASTPAATRNTVSPSESTGSLSRGRGFEPGGNARQAIRATARAASSQAPVFDMTDACELGHSAGERRSVVCPADEDRRPEGDR